MMDPSLWLSIGFIVFLIGLSAFCSASETAMTGASRPRLYQLEKDGDRAAARVNRLTATPQRLIGALLLGNNFVNTLIGVLTTSIMVALFGNEGIVVAAATGLVTIMLLVFGEVLPKTYAYRFSDATAMRVSGPVGIMVAVLSPITQTVQWLVTSTLKVFGVDLTTKGDEESTREGIRGAIELGRSEGLVEKSERDRLGGILDLSELAVADIMVHRKNVRMIDADLPSREIVAQALATSHSRLPLWRGDPENIIGVLHAKDLLQALADADGKLDSFDVAKVIREPWFVPDTTTLKEQLEAFLKKRNHFALIVDEYGAFMGLVTLEDILEEIVGDIVDEHDVAVQGVRPQPDGSVNVDGWVPIRDLNRAMEWDLPDEEAVTVAGLVIHEAQAIPDPGQRYTFHGYRFQILRKNRNQITALRIEAPAGDVAA